MLLGHTCPREAGRVQTETHLWKFRGILPKYVCLKLRNMLANNLFRGERSIRPLELGGVPQEPVALVLPGLAC